MGSGIFVHFVKRLEKHCLSALKMSWSLVEDGADNNVYLRIKDDKHTEFGRLEEITCSARDGVINLRFENNGKAVKISHFEAARSIALFAKCDTAEKFQSQLQAFYSEREKVTSGTRSASNEEHVLSFGDSFIRTSTPNQSRAIDESSTPSSGSLISVTPSAADNNTVITPADSTPASTRPRGSRKRIRLAEKSSSVDTIQHLPGGEDILSPIQRRFEECKVGKYIECAILSLSFSLVTGDREPGVRMDGRLFYIQVDSHTSLAFRPH